MLAPLTLLMLLSLLGSAIGFIISTNTTRDRILDDQLHDDATRLQSALQRRQQELIESAALLAQDREVMRALARSNMQSARPGALEVLDRRSVGVRDRFRLDQVIFVDRSGQVLVNLAQQSYLTAVNMAARDHMLASVGSAEAALVQVGELWLLVGGAAVWTDQQDRQTDQPVGAVYTLLDLSPELRRQDSDLGIESGVQLASAGIPIAAVEGHHQANLRTTVIGDAPELEVGGISFRIRRVPLELGGQPIQMALLRSLEASNAIVGAGFQVMLISIGLTGLLLLLLGATIASSFTRPIHKLVSVAQAVASGDRSSRANMTGADEIGQLGQAFDQATETIVRLLEQQARVSGELQAILQSIADGVLAVDRNERVLLLNPAGAAVLGRQADVLVGQQLSTLTNTSDPALLDAFNRVINQLRGELSDSGNAISEELVEVGARVVSLRSAPISGPGGARNGAVVVLQDITRTIEADRSKTEFIATASHELRTPLTSLVGYIDLFQLEGVAHLTDQQRFCMDALRRQSANMVVLVNDLLEMARIERGGLRSELRWIAPAQTVDDALAGLHNQFRLREIALTRAVAPDMPLIWFDGTHLRRVMTNLLSNAIKYSHTGGVVAVRVFPQQIDGLPVVTIEVEDHGVGIRAEDQSRIFTRFFRSHNPLSVEAGGTGLGLTITRALVELHGGQVGFRSVEGQGSCFWVHLPVQSDQLVLEAPAHAEQLA